MLAKGKTLLVAVFLIITISFAGSDQNRMFVSGIRPQQNNYTNREKEQNLRA